MRRHPHCPAPPLPRSAVAAWSLDNLLAVASGHSVSILSPADLGGPKAFVLHRMQHAGRVTHPGCSPAQPQANPSLLFTACNDRKMRFEGSCWGAMVRAVAWSPPGAAADAGCLLATLTEDHQARLLGARFRVPWVRQPCLLGALCAHSRVVACPGCRSPAWRSEGMPRGLPAALAPPPPPPPPPPGGGPRPPPPPPPRS